MKFFLLLGGCMLMLASCANVPQIDRGILAKRIMQFDPHPEETVFQDEVRAFREGAIGGGKAVGGGCGCN
ncbi:DUF4266 domain-containing protein [Bacteriovorax sp. PP10]|uniref:DUF4266 domain-containing protein n=1 Tax=Bacteriovorax antarcticus TaxID=3088717 RepID=A0ABU5VX51_9BACT|nr:DUF4266 domain-containing protein [Bacteriovorax sp. PP10]MEA9357639.1 DUF4266 domain-containing protein [Bacteriovorax sp. PP10]